MNQTKIFKILLALFAVVLCFGPVGLAEPLGTAFTYQGRLIDNNQPADGLYDLQFKLFDASSDGNQLWGDVNTPEVDVIDGYFTAELDFGSVFDSNAVWLDIGVRPGELGDPNLYTSLSPRQLIAPTPYALYAKTAGSGGGGGADSDWIISGNNMYSGVSGNVGIGTSNPSTKLHVSGVVTATGGNSTNWNTAYTHKTTEDAINGLIKSNGVGTYSAVTDNSANWNTAYGWGNHALAGYLTTFTETDPQVSSATANRVPKWNGSTLVDGTMYDNGTNVGVGTISPAYKLDVSGDINTISVYKIGGNTVLSVPGTANTLIGRGAGANNTGSSNTFSGYQAGYFNTEGYGNTFSGSGAGYDNNTGYYNTFSGNQAGHSNITGHDNTFSGSEAGYRNTTGRFNTFSGSGAGYSNTTGIWNTFSGGGAGYYNTTGNYNTFSGMNAGYYNTTGSDNTFSGNGAGYYNTTGYENTFSGGWAGRSNTTGYENTFSGTRAGYDNNTGNYNTFSGFRAGYSNTTGNYNTFSGNQAGYSNTTGSDNVFLGYMAGYNETGSNKLYIANSSVDANVLIYGDFSAGNVGIGTTSPAAKLEVAGVVKITGGSPAANKVLTSDASGLASWQNPTGGGGPDSDWIITGNNMYSGVSGAVGIGVTSGLTAKLNVDATTAGGIAVYGLHWSGNIGYLGGPSYGVSGFSTDNTGVIGASTNGLGVYGYSSNNYGVSGSSTNGGAGVDGSSSSGNGVYGHSNAIGVYGTSSGSSSNGVYGLSFGSSGKGVYGRHNSSGNYGYLGTSSNGVYGQSTDGNGVFGSSSSGYGVYGSSSSGNSGSLGGGNFGVQGIDSSGNYGLLGSSGYGVFGYNSSSGNSGSLGTSNYGVYGYSSSNIGVYGKNNSSGNYGYIGGSNYGVYGYSSSSYGVYGNSTSSNGVYGYSTNGIGVYGYGASYDFYAAGPGTDYGPFTGGHEVKLSDDFPADTKVGMIVSVTGKTEVRRDDAGKISISSTLPTVKLCNVSNDKAVFGVFVAECPLPEDHWYKAKESEHFATVNALGEGRAWVCNINDEIEVGDYITTSAVPGYGQKQSDDLLRSCTLGKATESVDWDSVTETVEFGGRTYKVYLIAVVYTSG